MDKKKKRLLAYAPAAQFTLPYIVQECNDWEVVTDFSSDFDAAAMISTTDVYNVTSGIDHDESTSQLQRHPMIDEEKKFSDACAARGISGTILRCPVIIATGMTGLPREMVNKIFRGSYFHIKGIEEHLSVVHATDIAQAVRLTIGSGDVLIVTDGDNPSYDQLAEALSYRLGNKRIFTIKERWARFRYNTALYNTLTNTLTFSCHRLKETYGYRPTPVCTYLTTHNYDENSL